MSSHRGVRGSSSRAWPATWAWPRSPPSRSTQLAHTPTDELWALEVLAPERVQDSGYAYALSKRANHLRVQGAAVSWG